MTGTHDLPAPGLLASMWRYRWATAAITLAVALLSAAAGLLLAPHPSASATVTLKNPGADNLLARGVVGDASLARYTKQRADFITSDDVLSVVSRAMPDHTVTSLRQDVDVVASTSSNQLTITATAATAVEAVQLANTVVESYRQATAAQVQRLTSAALASIAASRKALLDTTGRRGAAASAAAVSDLDRQTSALQTDSAVFNDGVDFVQQASAGDAVVPGLPWRYLAAGLILGAALAALLAWLRADRRRRTDDEGDAEPLLDAPLLGAVIVGRKHDPANPPAASRQYRLIGAGLGERARHAMVAVVAAGDAPQRPEVTYNLAVAMASEGMRVLVVDADPAATVSTWLWKGTPEWLRTSGAAPDDDAEARRRAVARHGALRGVGPQSRDDALPPTETVGVAAGVGLVARLAREGHPEATAGLSLPALVAAAADRPALNGHGTAGEAHGGGAVTGTVTEAPGANGVPAGGTSKSHGGSTAAPAAESEAVKPEVSVGGDPAPLAPTAERFGVAHRVGLPDDLELHLIALGQEGGRQTTAVRRSFVDDLAATADRYDLVLLDLPAPETSTLVPALLRVSTEILAVVPQGAEERSVEGLRRTASMFSTVVGGYVFTRSRK